MPVSWAMIFRGVVLLLMAAHAFRMYLLAPTLQQTQGSGASTVVTSSLFALAMLLPFAWAVALPELPEIYRRNNRHRRWRQHR